MGKILETLHIVKDGVLSDTEIVSVAIVTVVFLIAVLLVVKGVLRLVRYFKTRKESIFSHRKNKYKSRLGKKNKY